MPEPVVGNVSITVYDIFTNSQILAGLNVSNKLAISSISPVRAIPGYPVTLFGSDFYDISVNLSTYTYSVSTITFSTPSTGTGSIVVNDPYGNRSSIPFTVTQLSYAFQVKDQLTLVGQGLTDLSPGLPLSYPSDKAPMFTGLIPESVTLSKEGYQTATVPVYPVTVIGSAVDPDVVSVRGMPLGKIPYSSSIVTP
jgi:hypothetical protein